VRPASGSLRYVSDEESFDLAAAGLRADGADLHISLEVLASKLEESLPGSAHVERSGGGLLGRRERRVRLLRVDLGETRYQLTIDGARVEGFRERQVGGIAIKRESLDPGRWIAALAADLRAEAERSAQARAALESLLR
jgi:hypothetical protein